MSETILHSRGCCQYIFIKVIMTVSCLNTSQPNTHLLGTTVQQHSCTLLYTCTVLSTAVLFSQHICVQLLRAVHHYYCGNVCTAVQCCIGDQLYLAVNTCDGNLSGKSSAASHSRTAQWSSQYESDNTLANVYETEDSSEHSKFIAALQLAPLGSVRYNV